MKEKEIQPLQEKVEIVKRHPMLIEVVDWAVLNMVRGNAELKRSVIERLLAFAEEIAVNVLQKAGPVDLNNSTWKANVADSDYAGESFDQLKERRFNALNAQLKSEFEGKVRDLNVISFCQVAHATKCIAVMVANDQDPELLRLTDEEQNRKMGEFLAIAREAGATLFKKG